MYIYICIRLNINIKAPCWTILDGPWERIPTLIQTCAVSMCPWTRMAHHPWHHPHANVWPRWLASSWKLASSWLFVLPWRRGEVTGTRLCSQGEAPELQGCQASWAKCLQMICTYIPRLTKFQGDLHSKVTTIPRLPQLQGYHNPKVTTNPGLLLFQGYHSSKVTATPRLPFPGYHNSHITSIPMRQQNPGCHIPRFP